MVVKDPQISARELTLFFALTLICSIAYVLLSGPFVEGGAGSEAATVWYREKALVILWAPMTFALLMTTLFRRKAGLALLLRRFDPRAVGRSWWLAALLVPMAIHAVPVLISGGFTDRTAIEALSTWSSAFLLLCLIMVGEELGWRGYALPALQARFTPFIASLVLGGLWAVWHYPVWFGIGYGSSGEIGTGVAAVAVSTFGIIAMALVLTWFANKTNACVPVAMLYHGSNNAALRVYGNADGAIPFFVATTTVILVAIVIVVTNRDLYFRGARPADGAA